VSSISDATNSTLTLSGVQLSDAGSYSVTVSNPFGSTNSLNAELTVISAGPTSGLVVPNYSATNQYNGGGGIFSEVTREQGVYKATEFPPYPIVISEIRWRPDANAGGPVSTTVSNLVVHLSTTQANPDHLSTTFTQNTGSDDTLVFSGVFHASTSF